MEGKFASSFVHIVRMLFSLLKTYRDGILFVVQAVLITRNVKKPQKF